MVSTPFGFCAHGLVASVLAAAFKNFYCNMGVAADYRWIPPELWDACEADIDIDALAGERCLGGLDLGSVRDLTAVARFTDLWGFLAITTSHIVSAARAR